MSATRHPFAPEEIMAHIDGELSADRAQSVSAHIESCAACQELVTSLRNTSSSLSSWTVSPAPTSARFADQLSADAVNASSKLRESSGRKNWFLPIQSWKLQTGSAVLAVLLILIVGWRGGRYEMKAPADDREATVSNLHAELALQQNREARARASNSLPVDLARINSPGEKEYADRKMYTLNEPMAAPSNRLEVIGHGSGSGMGPVSADSNGIAHGLVDKGQSSFALEGKSISGQQSRLSSGPMIARTVALSIIAKDFDSSRATLEAVLLRHNGYAADLNVATPQGAARMLQASLRIPATQLPAALVEIKALGRAEAENQNGEEVTQQHADLVARLKNSRETEQRLQAILTQRTGKVGDVLSVEQEIARVRGEIEQMEAEQKNLEHRVDFSTIDLKLSEEYKAKLDSPAPAISTLIHNAAVNGYRTVANTLLSIVLFFAEYAPVLTFWLLMFSIPAWLAWRRWRHAAAI
jgi:hypothetical protein